MTLDVGGVVMAVDVPAGWLPPLVERYAAFVSDAPPAWQVTLHCEPALQTEDPGWIEHVDLRTRFHVQSYAGWLDLAAHVAAISTASQERAFSALERILVYICMQTLPRSIQGCCSTPVASFTTARATSSSGLPGQAKPAWRSWRPAMDRCCATKT